MARPYITAQEVAVTKRSMMVLGPVLLAVACNSALPIAPTTVQPPATLPAGTASTPPNGPAVIVGTRVSAGTPVEGTIDERDPACFYNWDATGLCRQFDVTAAADGRLVATLTWPGPSRGLLYDPDVFLVAPNGLWVYSQDQWPEKHATLPATSGLTYRIVVMSYGQAPLPFVLSVDLRP